MKLICTATLVVAAAVASSGCGGSAPSTPQENPPAAPAGQVRLSDEAARDAGIVTAAVRRIERNDPFQAPGVVAMDERRTARMGSLVQGVVEHLPVQVGDRVTRGTVVAQLHSHVVHDAWAAYFTALARRRRLDTELSYAQTAESRAARLVADKALSTQELERARADVNAVKQDIAAADAEIIRTEQELDHYGVKARPDADPHSNESVPVFSPFTGVVIERPVTEGAAVNPGSPLVVVSDLSQVWVIAEVDEAHLGRLSSGGQVVIRAAAYPGESFTGRLAAIGDVVNPQTRRVTVRIEAANADRRLKPEMYVTVDLAASRPRSVLVAPARAVQSMDGETVVFVRSSSGMFVRRSVVTGTDLEGDVEIVRGLEEGDVVATAGAFLLKSELSSAGEEP